VSAAADTPGFAARTPAPGARDYFAAGAAPAGLTAR
jgi:hypothetical protein